MLFELFQSLICEGLNVGAIKLWGMFNLLNREAITNKNSVRKYCVGGLGAKGIMKIIKSVSF